MPDLLTRGELAELMCRVTPAMLDAASRVETALMVEHLPDGRTRARMTRDGERLAAIWAAMMEKKLVELDFALALADVAKGGVTTTPSR